MIVQVMLLGTLLSVIACSDIGSNYFQQDVNEATQDAVARRYGMPHQVDHQQDGRSAWVYFKRGSATSSFTGSATSTYCRAYVLTFDKQGVLREWREDDCSG